VSELLFGSISLSCIFDVR